VGRAGKALLVRDQLSMAHELVSELGDCCRLIAVGPRDSCERLLRGPRPSFDSVKQLPSGAFKTKRIAACLAQGHLSRNLWYKMSSRSNQPGEALHVSSAAPTLPNGGS